MQKIKEWATFCTVSPRPHKGVIDVQTIMQKQHYLIQSKGVGQLGWFIALTAYMTVCFTQQGNFRDNLIITNPYKSAIAVSARFNLATQLVTNVFLCQE